MTSPQLNFLFVPYHNTGGHFLCWSLYYLRGQTQAPAHAGTVHVAEPQYLNGRRNWHKQKAYYVEGWRDYQIIWQNLDRFEPYESVNFYLGPRLLQHICQEQMGQDLINLDPQQILQAKTMLADDTRRCLEHIQAHGHNLLFFDFLAQDIDSIWYNDRYPRDYLLNECKDIIEPWTSLEQAFYPGMSDNFSTDFVWDQREKIALIYQSPDITNWYGMIDRGRPHLYYTNDDVWNGLETLWPEILQFLGAELDHSRWDGWLAAYQSWRTVHDPWLSRHLDRIVDGIVNNHYISLRRFQMDFMKECLIQHQLIVKHNLNLRTWQLEHFPDNTQDLHQLLEPNQHKI